MRRPQGFARLIKKSVAGTFATALVLALLSPTGAAVAEMGKNGQQARNVETQENSDLWFPEDDCDELLGEIRAGALRADTEGSSAACITPLDAPEGEVWPSGILPAPGWCTPDTVTVRRTEACGLGYGKLTVYDVQTGEIEGEMTYGQLVYALTSATSTNWQYQATLSEFSSWGDAVGTSLSATGWCTGSCTTGSQSWPTKLLSDGTTYEGYTSADATVPNWGDIGPTVIYVKLTMSNPKWISPRTSTVRTAPARCDNVLPGRGPGCVFEVMPEMTYSLTGPYPELAAHIRDAQSSGLPGGTSNRPLHRLTDDLARKKNRDKACPGSLVRPPGKDCDEYPFASTWEGAATGSEGYSIRMIDSTQNQTGGSALASFYNKNRVIEQDPFTVVITP